MRNNALDAAKLVACFFIVFVHVGGYQEISAPWGETLRVMVRWAVPFFFLASGYTIGNSDAGAILKRVNKLISILFYGSVLYIPMVCIQNDGDVFRSINKIFSADTLHYGLYGHLWFIGALITGLILFWYVRSNLSHTRAMFIAIIIIIMCWLGDAIKSFDVQLWFFYVFRYLLGFSLVYIGWCVGVGYIPPPRNNKVLVLVFAMLLLLSGLEYYISLIYFNGGHGERQFPLACIPAALVLLFLCVNLQVKNSYLSYAGASYSLGVYIIHPMVIFIIAKIAVFLRVYINSTSMLLLGFSTSLMLMILIKNLIPYTYKKMNGVEVR